MVICKNYKSPVLSLSPCPLRRRTGRFAQGMVYAGNGFLKNPLLFLRNTKLIAVTMVLCSTLAAGCNKGQIAFDVHSGSNSPAR